MVANSENEYATLVKDLEAQLDSAFAKLESYEKGKEYRRLLESEDKLRELEDYTENMRGEMHAMQEALQQRET